MLYTITFLINLEVYCEERCLKPKANDAHDDDSLSDSANGINEYGLKCLLKYVFYVTI